MKYLLIASILFGLLGSNALAAWQCQANYQFNNPYQTCVFTEPQGVVGGEEPIQLNSHLENNNEMLTSNANLAAVFLTTADKREFLLRLARLLE
jgi:hypothetical protein